MISFTQSYFFLTSCTNVHVSAKEKQGRTTASLGILYVFRPLNIYCHWNAKREWWKMRCFKFSALNQYEMCTLRLCWSSCFLQSFPKATSFHSIHLPQMAAPFDLFSVCIALCFLTEAVAEQKATSFLSCSGYCTYHPTGWDHFFDQRTWGPGFRADWIVRGPSAVPCHAGKSHIWPCVQPDQFVEKQAAKSPQRQTKEKPPVFCWLSKMNRLGTLEVPGNSIRKNRIAVIRVICVTVDFQPWHTQLGESDWQNRDWEWPDRKLGVCEGNRTGKKGSVQSLTRSKARVLLNPIQHRISTWYTPKSAPRMGHCMCVRGSCWTSWLSAPEHHVSILTVHQHACCDNIHLCMMLL